MSSIISRAGLGAILSVCFAFGCATEATEETDDSNELIVGGQTDQGHLATALVLYTDPTDNGTGVCSGTLISPTVVLTAAHCVVQKAPGKPFVNHRVWFGTDAINEPNLQSKMLPGKAYANPAYDIENPFGKGTDAAVIVLAKPVTNVTPVPINRSPLDQKFVGATVTAAGFGFTDGVKKVGIGVKRSVTSQVAAVSAKEFKFGVPGKTTCQGDSGGSMYVGPAGKEILVGIVSYGPLGCTGAQSSARVDQNLAFIDPFLKNTTTPPPPAPAPAPTPAPAGCTGPTEAEPNDVAPNALGASVCGTVAGADVDKFTFTAPTGQARIRFVTNGNARLVIRTGGSQSSMSGSGTSNIATGANAKFDLEVHAGTGAQTYTIIRE